MSQIRISVITPVLNQAEYLERAICSVLDQGCDRVEHIVVDGGSSDGSVELIKQYANELAYWESAPDSGPADAINRGLAHAKGQFIAVLPADDLYLPGALQQVSRLLDRDDRPDWLIGRCVRIGASDQMLGELKPAHPRSLAAYLMHDSGLYPTASSFISRRLLDRHGPFDAGLQFAFDYEYCCRLLIADVWPTLIGHAVAARREHPASLSATNMVQQGLEYVAAARRHGHQLPLAQRCALWHSCDCRQRIYALARAEILGEQARAYLWLQLLRHPWWFAHDGVRHTLVHGVEHRQPPHRRHAA